MWILCGSDKTLMWILCGLLCGYYVAFMWLWFGSHRGSYVDLMWILYGFWWGSYVAAMWFLCGFFVVLMWLWWGSTSSLQHCFSYKTGMWWKLFSLPLREQRVVFILTRPYENNQRVAYTLGLSESIELLHRVFQNDPSNCSILLKKKLGQNTIIEYS